jgi:uncharacterized NAD-dependent epimerase/dehydratase family protein
MIPTRLNRPYLVFLGNAPSELDAKTGHGLAYWRPDHCVGQLRYDNCNADTGLPDMDIGEAIVAGAQSLLIGVAPTGGGIDPAWTETLVEALDSGLDVVSGMHTRLETVPGLAEAATRSGARLVDLRVPPDGIPIASGKRRTGKRLLTVGTDCCVGKKYTALALQRAMREHGVDATFRATGQTGIAIAGEGIPIDAVVSDFLPGAAEILSPDNSPEHWDVIEGQGSLYHPAYAAVTLGLLHGSQPDALVMCHEAGRSAIDDYPDYAIPTLVECIRSHEQAAALTNPKARCTGVSINTSSLADGERERYLRQCGQETGLPCVDPLIDGVQPLLSQLSATADD